MPRSEIFLVFGSGFYYGWSSKADVSLQSCGSGKILTRDLGEVRAASEDKIRGS